MVLNINNGGLRNCRGVLTFPMLLRFFILKSKLNMVVGTYCGLSSRTRRVRAAARRGAARPTARASGPSRLLQHSALTHSLTRRKPHHAVRDNAAKEWGKSAGPPPEVTPLAVGVHGWQAF